MSDGGDKVTALVSKIKSFVGLVSGLEEEDEMLDELYRASNDYTSIPESLGGIDNRQELKVVNHPTSKGYEVMVVEPRSFEESLEIVDKLRERKSVVLNLHLLDADQSQRIVDFLSGATHAVDGNQQKIGEGVFIFTPNNVSIASETEKARVIRDAFWNQPKQ